jgi:hypothetical protein
MQMKRKILAGLIAASVTGSAMFAFAAGFYPNVPLVGGPAYCYNTVNGVCQATVPAGAPALTGSETTAIDTGLPQGQFPQTELVPTSVLGLPFGVNRLVGGDFNTNLEQRLSTTKGIASLAGVTATAAVMSADGWWLYGLGTSNNTVTIASGSTEVLPALGTTKALRVARTTSTTGALECVGQTLDQNQAAPLIGSNAVFSFWELNGAGQSASGAAFTVQVSYSSNTAAAGTQATLGFAGSVGSKYAIGTNATTFGTGGPTNQTAAVPVLVAGTTGSIGANQFVTIAGSTTWTRYAVAFPIPANIPTTTTAVTDVSVQVCFTPTGTGASTTDWIELQGLQLEAKPSGVTPTLPNGVITPTAFERRPASIESLIDYSYWYYRFEDQALVGPVTGTACTTTTSTTAGACVLTYPVPMRIAPAVKFTDGFQAFTSTAYTTLGAASSLAVYSNTLVTVANNYGVMFSFAASTLPAVGTQNFLMNLGTSSATGIISASAEP